METINNFISNNWIKPNSKEYLPGINPATGENFYQLANSNEIDLELAIESSKQALHPWQSMSLDQRSNCLAKLADLIEQNIDELAKLESLDNGKPISLASSIDIPRSAKNFRFYAHALTQFSAKSYQGDDKSLSYVLQQPLGIVACISPWNLPLYLLTWKIAPALAAGNCVIAKPSELTPLTANKLSELIIKAGFPAGVLNILHGEGQQIGELLCKHPQVKAVSFTGGTETGKLIAQNVAQDFKKVSLELGGKNAAVIFADCDFDRMLDTTMRSSFANQGEICLCTSRIFIERSIFDKTKLALIEQVKKIKTGKPNSSETQFGALVSKQHLNKIDNFVIQAKQDGCEIIIGGSPYQINDKGYYFEPTLITGLANDAAINQQEVFGPVSCLIPFDSEQEVLAMVNDSKYGLSATVWTKDINRAHRLADKIATGIVWLNTWMLRDLRTPFGGAKQSGLGREGGFDALDFFTEKKTVCLQY